MRTKWQQRVAEGRPGAERRHRPIRAEHRSSPTPWARRRCSSCCSRILRSAAISVDVTARRLVPLHRPSRRAGCQSGACRSPGSCLPTGGPGPTRERSLPPPSLPGGAAVFFCGQALSVGRAARRLVDGLERGFERQQDRGVAVAGSPARARSTSSPSKGASGTGPPSFSIARSWSRRRAIVAAVAADHDAAEDRGRGLTQRAGLHVLPEVRDPRRPRPQVHRHGRAAERRALARPCRPARPAGRVRDVGRQREDAPRSRA